MKVTIEVDEERAIELINSKEKINLLESKYEVLSTDRQVLKDKYEELVEALKACVNAWSTGGLYIDSKEDNKPQMELITKVLK